MYALSGSGRIQLFAQLTDETTTDVVFESLQRSVSTPDQKLTLGLEEGDTINSLIGTLDGVLIAGHEYKFQYGYTIRIESPALPDGGASASGFLSFNITPEPGSAVLLGFGGMALLRRCRRKRHHV
jgi:hypothetical protein